MGGDGYCCIAFEYIEFGWESGFRGTRICDQGMGVVEVDENLQHGNSACPYYCMEYGILQGQRCFPQKIDVNLHWLSCWHCLYVQYLFFHFFFTQHLMLFGLKQNPCSTLLVEYSFFQPCVFWTGSTMFPWETLMFHNAHCIAQLFGGAIERHLCNVALIIRVVNLHNMVT